MLVGLAAIVIIIIGTFSGTGYRGAADQENNKYQSDQCNTIEHKERTK